MMLYGIRVKEVCVYILYIYMYMSMYMLDRYMDTWDCAACLTLSCYK